MKKTQANGNKGGKKHRKLSEIISGLPQKKARYLKARAEGKSKLEAGLEAGYSESSARNAAAIIESPDVRAAFQQIMRRAVPPEKIAQRIREGMDAEETKFFQSDGQVCETYNVVAWEERRKYTELAAKYGGYFVEKSELDVHGSIADNGGERLAELLARAASRAGSAPQSV